MGKAATASLAVSTTPERAHRTASPGKSIVSRAALGKVCKKSARMCFVKAEAAGKIAVMKQAELGLSLTTKRTRKREFLDEMERVVPWQALIELITPYAPQGKRGRPPFPVETMLRIHFMQQCSR